MKAMSRLVLALVLMQAADTFAASWNGDLGARGRVIFSDNLFLSSVEPESGGVLQLRPYLSSQGNGNRVRARINYGPSFLWYPNHAELNAIQHVLDASLTAEVVDRYFFVDVYAKANPALTNPRTNTGFNAVANPDAFTQTASIQVKPRFVLPIAGGRFATARFSPGLGLVASASTAGDGRGTRRPVTNTTLNVASGPMFGKFPWSVNWRRRLFDAETGDGFGRFDVRLGYIFNARYRADVILGYDDGDYTTSNGRSQGSRWELRGTWTPRPSSRLELGVGQAYYGNLFRLRANHRHKRWAFRAEYRATVENATTEILQQQIVPVEDLFGNPIVNPITGPDVVTASIETPVLVDDTYVRDRLLLSAEYMWGRNQAWLQWWATRRNYSNSELDTSDSQLRLRYSRRLSGRLSAGTTLRLWDHSEEQVGAYDFVQNEIDLRVNYTLGPRSSVGARIGRQSRDSSAPQGDFSENRFSLDFNYLF